MLRYVPYHDRERRRVPRYPWEIDIVLRPGDDPKRRKTSDVSLYGAFVVTEALEPIDRVVAVRVPQGMDDPVDWMGVVRRVVRPEKARPDRPAGIGLEIFSIAEPDWVRWVWVIARVADRVEGVLAPEIERDSGPSAAVAPRRHARHETPVEVRIKSMPDLVRFGARDISAGGVFVRPAPPLDLGDEVQLQVRHPLSGKSFQLEGRVVRVESGGVAVEFQNLSAATRERLKRFIVTGQRPQ